MNYCIHFSRTGVLRAPGKILLLGALLAGGVAGTARGATFLCIGKAPYPASAAKRLRRGRISLIIPCQLTLNTHNSHAS